MNIETQALTVQQHDPLSTAALSERFALEQRMAGLFAISGLFADIKGATHEQALAQAYVKIALGGSMGFSPAESMEGIYIISGRPSVGSQLRAARMQRAGYRWDVMKLDDTGCALMIWRNGEKLGEASFLEKDAKSAGLLVKDNWKKDPSSMYFARAITRAQRRFAPGVLSLDLPTQDEAIDITDYRDVTDTSGGAQQATEKKTEELATKLTDAQAKKAEKAAAKQAEDERKRAETEESERRAREASQRLDEEVAKMKTSATAPVFLDEEVAKARAAAAPDPEQSWANIPKEELATTTTAPSQVTPINGTGRPVMPSTDQWAKRCSDTFFVKIGEAEYRAVLHATIGTEDRRAVNASNYKAVWAAMESAQRRMEAKERGEPVEVTVMPPTEDKELLF